MGPSNLSSDSQKLAEEIALRYLRRVDLSHDLIIRFDPSGFSNDQIKRELKAQPTRKVSYNQFNQKIKIYSMAPSPLHNKVSNFLGRFLMRCVRAGFFDDYEADRVSISSDPVIIRSTSTTPNPPTQNKPLAFAKYSDASIAFGLPGQGQRQTVVFEVGLSEKEEDLIADAQQWLLCTGGETKLVVVINVKEDRKSLQQCRRALLTIRRRNELVQEYGNTKAKSENIVPEGGSDESDEDESDGSSKVSADEQHVYDAITSKLKVDDWVGPVTATVELWDLDRNGTPRRREGPTVSPLVDFKPCLY